MRLIIVNNKYTDVLIFFMFNFNNSYKKLTQKLKVQFTINHLNLLGKGSSKAQSAMEYLMTYGWSILVIAIGVVTLFALGVFNGGSSTGNSGCIAQSGYLCTKLTLATNGTLNTTIGTEYSGITITGVSCSNSSATPTTFNTITPSLTINNGQEDNLNFQCPLSSNTLGTAFTGTLWIQYNSGSADGQIISIGKVSVKSTRVGSMLLVSISPSSGGTDTGKSITLTATPSGGPSPYTYQWYTAASSGTCTQSDTQISGATSSTYLASPSSNTFYCVIVHDSSGQSTSSSTDQITVNPSLAANSISPLSPSIVIGNGVTLAETPIGGTQPYSYQWYTAASAGTCSPLDSAISGATSNTYLASPTSNTYYCATISDAYGETANTLTNMVVVYPVLNNPSYETFTSSSTASVTTDPGNTIYLCEIESDSQISSESWTQSTNTLHTSIGIQGGNTCSATTTSVPQYGTMIDIYGITTATTSYSSFLSSYSTSPASDLDQQYTVTNSINTVVIAFVRGDGGGTPSPSLPAGCVMKLQQTISSDGQEVYYALCTNQSPGQYTVSVGGDGGGSSSISIYVFENHVSIQPSNPAYYITSQTTPSVTTISGNTLYICEIESDSQINSESWTQSTNTLHTSIGIQGGNTCSATTTSVPQYGTMTSIYGITASTTSYSLFSSNYSSSPTEIEQQYTVTNSINTVVIAFVRGGGGGAPSPSLPTGCVMKLQQTISNDGQEVYYALCTDQTPGQYNVFVNGDNGGYSAIAVFVFENPIYNNVPITLSNSQSSATGTNFQDMISFNPSTYSNYETGNLSNIEFTAGAPIGTSGNIPLYAWIESGASSTATNTVAWVNLASNTLGAAGSGTNTLTIYMNFLPDTSPVTSGYTGYAPQLYCASGCFQTSYAQYDTGGNVFNFYDNFAGNVLSSKWDVVTAYTMNNGLTLSSAGGEIYSTSTFSSGILDFYGYFETGATTSSNCLAVVGLINSGNPNDGAEIGYACGYGFRTMTTWPGTFLSGLSFGSNELYSLIVPSTSEMMAQINYGSTLISTTTLPTLPMPIEIYNQGNAGIPTGPIYYIRFRAYPPNGVMPSASFGSVV